MKEKDPNLSFAQSSIRELFYGMMWLSGILFLRFSENLPIPMNLKTAFTAICFIALASKGFKGLEFIIKSWKNKEPNTPEKYIGTIGNTLISFFFVAAILWAFLGKFLG
ncbi:MAG: hypothetical protein NXI23_14770 [Bacteroidetes bacterium]|jgi:hypothetical protein|nr:hypothetical protein [Bacteroidota bacterium]MDF1867779.1 hypothetical protein [Saprospiraceae bacterium]